ncbi:uncharacterized protein LOC144903978 [Branchiostoma floridae x Branchiostoma belcheri]
MKALLFLAVTVCVLGAASCCFPWLTEPAPTQAPTPTPCPPGVSQVNCLTDPCVLATCPPYPSATCKADYCGGCNAFFYDSNDNKVNCDDPYCPNGGQYLSINCGRGVGRRDCPSTHSCQVHPADRWAVCCPNTVAGECPDTTGMFGICVEACSSDADCSGGQKCCSNGCGHVCMAVTKG